MLSRFVVWLLGFALLARLGLLARLRLPIFGGLLLLRRRGLLRCLFLLGGLLLLSLDDPQLRVQLLLEVVLDGLERVLQLVEGCLLELDGLVVFQQLAAQVVRILLPLVLDDLLHLLEHGLVLFVEGALVQGKVLVVQVEALVLLLDLLRQRLAECFNPPVQL